MAFVSTKQGAAFVSARGAYGDAAPLWLLGDLSVRSSPGSLVAVAPGGNVQRFASLARRAVVDVRKVLKNWRGKLVVEVPASEQELDRVLGADPGRYTGIAAVTTTVDGTLRPGTPIHIFVNPAVFDPLGPQGSQIVISHEATHVATAAPVSSAPTWLLEGFADYVALDHVDLPVSVTAAQALASVRQHGAPRQLPTAQDFDPRHKALGGTYEAAWLACRLLGQKYGERTLLSFYRASNRLGSTADPFRRILHTSEAAFTRDWRRDLTRLAR